MNVVVDCYQCATMIEPLSDNVFQILSKTLTKICERNRLKIRKVKETLSNLFYFLLLSRLLLSICTLMLRYFFCLTRLEWLIGDHKLIFCGFSWRRSVEILKSPIGILISSWRPLVKKSEVQVHQRDQAEF